MTSTRLHISSLPPSTTEYVLLRLLQPYGRLTSLDLLFTPTGEPRGYAFASFTTRETAEAARVGLDGKSVGGRTLRVRWAMERREEEAGKEGERRKRTIQSPSAGTVLRTVGPKTTAGQIYALERKLSEMKSQASTSAPVTTTTIPSTSSKSQNQSTLSQPMKRLVHPLPKRPDPGIRPAPKRPSPPSHMTPIVIVPEKRKADEGELVIDVHTSVKVKGDQDKANAIATKDAQTSEREGVKFTNLNEGIDSQDLKGKAEQQEQNSISIILPKKKKKKKIILI